MSRLLGVVVLGLVATLGCQKPEKADANAKADPVVAASADPVKPADLAFAAGEEGCCKPTVGKPSCDEAAGAPSNECGCPKAPGKECPHHAAPASSGEDKGHEGCPHAGDGEEGAPCPCKEKGHEGCPHAGS